MWSRAKTGIIQEAVTRTRICQAVVIHIDGTSTYWWRTSVCVAGGTLTFRHLLSAGTAMVVHLVRGGFPFCSIWTFITHLDGCSPFLISNSVHGIFRLYPFKVSWGPVINLIGMGHCPRYSIYETAFILEPFKDQTNWSSHVGLLVLLCQLEYYLPMQISSVAWWSPSQRTKN